MAVVAVAAAEATHASEACNELDMRGAAANAEDSRREDDLWGDDELEGGGLEGGAGGGLMGSCLTTTPPAVAKSDWPVTVDTGTAGKHSESMSSILMCGVMESGESGPSSLDVMEYECSDCIRGDWTASDIMRSCRMMGLSSMVDQSDSELMSTIGDSKDSWAHSSLRSESPMS